MGSHKHKHPPGSGFLAQNLPGKFGGIGCTEWIVLHSPQASTPGAARYGSLCLKPFLYLKDGLTQTQTPARLGVPCSESPGEVRRDRIHKMDSAPLAPGLHAGGCILPWLIRAEASPCTRQKRVSFPTQPPEQGVSTKKLTGKDGEVGDTESNAAPPGAMQQAQKPKEAYA